MWNKSKLCRLAVLGLLTLWTGFSLADGPAPARRVLVLFSGARDTDYEMQMEAGLRRSLARDAPDARYTPDVVYLDMMDGYDSALAALHGQMLALRAGSELRYDGVLVIGRQAARFVSHWRTSVAPRVPVAVAGLFPEVREIPGDGVHVFDVRPGFATGVELVSALAPAVRRLLVINGQGEQDQVLMQMARSQLAGLGNRYQVSYLDRFTMPELLERVGGLPADTAILYGVITRDLTGPGRRVHPAEHALLVSRASKVPMFCVLENAVAHGACVAGFVLGGERTGVQVADALKRLLATPGAALARPAQPLARIDGDIVANWEAMRRWGLSTDRLPADSEVRGRPLRLVDTHPLQLAAGLAVVLLLSAGVLLLVRALRVNRGQRLQLSELEQRWVFALESAGHGVWDWHIRTGQVCYSAGWLKLLGLDRVAPTPLARVERIHPDDDATVEAALEHWLRDHGDEVHGAEFRLRHGDGHYRWVHERARVVERDAAGLPMRVVATVEDIGERRAHLAQIRHLATHDPLTGLPNRSLLDDRMQQALHRARRQGGKFAVVFLDLDHFKTVNDTLGHHAGDELLVAVAARLARPLRAIDTLTRQGGDEFVLLLSDIGDGVAEVVRLCGLLQAAVSEPIMLGGREWRVSASMGIALYPVDAERADHLLQKADAALYRAKANGRRGICFYTDALNTVLTRKLALEGRMQSALQAGEFQVWYQPQYGLHDGVLHGAEALMRWISGDGSRIGPDEFIPVAEEFGHIHALGAWALKQACLQAVQWARIAGRPLPVAVNLSGVQFRRSDLVDSVADVLRETGLPPSSLVLEITESVLMDNTPASLATMAGLTALGVQLAIDDFGTGYSSLASLKHFPVHHIKIDRTFVRDLATDADDAVIVRMIIQLGHGMGLTVLAEGVETLAQAARLRELGCDQMQGFLRSPALAALPFIRDILPSAHGARIAVN